MGHKVEHLLAGCKDWRPIATRYDHCAHAFLSAVLLTATLILWLSVLISPYQSLSVLISPELNDHRLPRDISPGFRGREQKIKRDSALNRPHPGRR